ncbi:hypothetical protein RRG08_009498 [Elysia crispata]|uniref:Cytochrome P450 n=1 Tax=Elysia crispata TaxID=231223 RepID=A0AAE0YKQ2_9GAST|nr:hypothetical protein RRG08_009498 [Elysia crispata]
MYLALTLGVIVLVKYFFRSRQPAKPYPILGHLPYFKNGLRDQLEKWKMSTGEMFSLYFGSELVVILASYDAAYQAFVKHGDTLSDRPKSLAVNLGGEEQNRGISLASGHVWKEQRGVGLQILRSFGMGKNILALKVSEEMMITSEG